MQGHRHCSLLQSMLVPSYILTWAMQRLPQSMPRALTPLTLPCQSTKQWGSLVTLCPDQSLCPF